MTIRCLLILLLTQLSACSWFSHKGDCADDSCDNPSKLIVEKQVVHKWYCYGEADGEKWDCLDKPDTSKIVAVTPHVIAPVKPDELPGTTERTVTGNQQPVTKPLLNITNSIEGTPDDNYTVQLDAAGSEQELAEFAQEHNIIQPVYIVVPGDEGPTYILVLGVFEDQDKALEAKHIWQRGRKLKVEPWVRKIGPLKTAIEAKDKNS